MKRFFYIIYLLFTLTTLVPTDALAQKVVKSEVADLLDCQQKPIHRKDALHEVKTPQHPREAVVDNSSLQLRTTNTRPQRLNPIFGTSQILSFAESKFCYFSTISPYRKSLHARPSQPIRIGPAAEYFVFALGHIICWNRFFIGNTFMTMQLCIVGKLFGMVFLITFSIRWDKQSPIVKASIGLHTNSGRQQFVPKHSFINKKVTKNYGKHK